MDVEWRPTIASLPQPPHVDTPSENVADSAATAASSSYWKTLQLPAKPLGGWPAATLQLATSTQVFVVDLLMLSLLKHPQANLSSSDQASLSRGVDKLARLLTDPSFYKIGFGFDSDVARMAASYPWLYTHGLFSQVTPVVEVCHFVLLMLVVMLQCWLSMHHAHSLVAACRSQTCTCEPKPLNSRVALG